MEPLSFADIVDLGLSGILLLQVYTLWKEKKSQDERLFRYLEEAKAERHKMRNELQSVKTSTEVLEQKVKNGT